MGHIKNINQSIILLFSESIWIYYSIVLFTSIEWNEIAFFRIHWWIAAGILGFLVHVFMLGRQSIFMYLVNVIIFGLVAVINWIQTVPEGHWIFGLAVTSALAFIYIRSALFVIKGSTRLQMISHFEFNILLYVVFSLFFTFNDIIHDTSHHFIFISAIVLSLLGMILTLKHHEQNSQEEVDIRKVGHSGWFTGAITAGIASIVLLCFLMMLPSIRGYLSEIILSGWDGLKWIGAKLYLLLMWFLGLFPKPDAEGELPEPPNTQMTIQENMQQEIIWDIPYMWIAGILTVIGLLLILWILSKFMKGNKKRSSLAIQHVIIEKESFWANLYKRLLFFYQSLRKKWRMRSARFYKEPIFWYFYQVQKWGSKNKLKREKAETSREYIERMISFIRENNGTGELVPLLRNLNQDYESAYYGMKKDISAHEYRVLLNGLKEIKITQTNNLE